MHADTHKNHATCHIGKHTVHISVNILTGMTSNTNIWPRHSDVHTVFTHEWNYDQATIYTVCSNCPITRRPCIDLSYMIILRTNFYLSNLRAYIAIITNRTTNWRERGSQSKAACNKWLIFSCSSYRCCDCDRESDQHRSANNLLEIQKNNLRRTFLPLWRSLQLLYWYYCSCKHFRMVRHALLFLLPLLCQFTCLNISLAPKGY